MSPSWCSASMWGTNTATAFFITRALLTTCGKNMRPEPKQVSNSVHPIHQGAFNDVKGAFRLQARLFYIDFDMGIYSVHQSMANALTD